tara:strand:+ start:56 stop:1105 length:1050 start_codon:yes stop_codon:yes gene_type:complete
MEKKKDVLLLFLLKDYCKNNGIEEKYSIIKEKLETEKILEKGMEELSIRDSKKMIEYFPEEPVSKFSQNINFYENIGSGSFGNVFKCFHQLDKNDYAIKIVPVYNDIKKDKYIGEVQMMSKLDHPNIVRYYNSWIEKILPRNFDTEKLCLEDEGDYSSEIISDFTINEFLFIQMELCFGNLSDYLAKREIINYLESNNIFIDIVKGLNYLHKMNIIHRDIKPSNIMFDEDGKAKIGDFGMSIKYDEIDCISGRKTENEYGTFNYLAPECVEAKKYSFYSDVYSLGIILFELLSLFSTFMEKQNKINELKKEGIIEDTIGKRESVFIKMLLDKNIYDRPLTHIILKKINK